ncbi:hypothetical protein BHF71_00600 [Vulcanibacillus modesticaldus]|uniref:YlxR domain-containing protein n=1 Tax=Vulcanibacillus modesticaldus TaxID=337097 RepID=A0A1D2YXD1_9BACI|nr:YlxR family protein [Vulcanibacillus modesticaldus]OEG00441.1 hypothetical protein BHF71_00600 [Vulcanibacillus modesticaldus]
MKKIPMRKCVACQEMKPKRELLRIVRTPEKDVVIDLKGKKSGRGAYICYGSECLQKAKKRKSLDRALEVVISDEVYEQLQSEIEGYREK